MGRISFCFGILSIFSIIITALITIVIIFRPEPIADVGFANRSAIFSDKMDSYCKKYHDVYDSPSPVNPIANSTSEVFENTTKISDESLEEIDKINADNQTSVINFTYSKNNDFVDSLNKTKIEELTKYIIHIDFNKINSYIAEKRFLEYKVENLNSIMNNENLMIEYILNFINNFDKDLYSKETSDVEKDSNLTKNIFSDLKALYFIFENSKIIENKVYEFLDSMERNSTEKNDFNDDKIDKLRKLKILAAIIENRIKDDDYTSKLCNLQHKLSKNLKIVENKINDTQFMILNDEEKLQLKDLIQKMRVLANNISEMTEKLIEEEPEYYQNIIDHYAILLNEINIKIKIFEYRMKFGSKIKKFYC